MLWLKSQIYAERDRWILWLPVLFGGGIGLYFNLFSEPASGIAAGVGLGFLLAAFVLRSMPLPCLVCIAVVVTSIGFEVAKFRSDQVATPQLSKPIGPIGVSGRIVRIEDFPGRPRLTLDRLQWAQKSGIDLVPERIQLRLVSSNAFEIGDRVRGRLKALPLPAPVSPGSFDFQRSAWFKKIGATAFAVGRFTKVEPLKPSNLWQEPNIAIAKFRQSLSKKILHTIPGPEGAVVTALITGDRSRIPKDITSAMRDSGLAHLLAISGLHIGLVTSIVFAVVRLFLVLIPGVSLRIDCKKWAAGAALVASFGYLLISGGSLPTQLAFVMGAFVLCAVMLDREAISLRLVAFAALFVLCLRPESILSASFQMSFAAVTALVAFYESAAPLIRERLPAPMLIRHKLAIYLLGLAVTTVVAGLATGAIAYFHFGRVTHYGLIANLLAVPLTAFWIMPAAIIGCLAIPFGLGAMPLEWMAFGVGNVLAIAEEVASWPGAVTLVSKMPMYPYLLVVLGGIWLCLMRQKWRYIGILAMFCGFFSGSLAAKPDILFSESGKLFAVRLADGQLKFGTGSQKSFTANKWLEQSGQSGARAIGGQDRLRCDWSACIYTRGPHQISLVRHPSAFEEDCRRAVLVLTPLWRRTVCNGKIPSITKRQLRKSGAHAVYLRADDISVVTVAETRGVRPWTQTGGYR